MPVEIAATGHRAFAADVEGAERIDLAGVRDADDHAELLLHRRIGCRRLHAAELERRAAILIEVGEEGRGLHGVARKAQRRTGAHRAGCFGDGRSILGHQGAGDTVEGAHAGQIVLHDRHAGGLARADRPVQVVDRRFLEAER